MEKYPSPQDYEGKYDRPEDILSNEKEVFISKRSQEFSVEGGFQNMLKTKIALDDLRRQESLITYMGSDFSYVAIEKPEEVDWIKVLDRIQAVREYVLAFQTATHLDTLNAIKNYAEEMKNAVNSKDYKEFVKIHLKAQSYLWGMKELLDNFTGSMPEDEDVRKILKVG